MHSCYLHRNCWSKDLKMNDGTTGESKLSIEPHLTQLLLFRLQILVSAPNIYDGTCTSF